MSLIDKIKIGLKKREKLTAVLLSIIFVVIFICIYDQSCRGAQERFVFFVILVLVAFWRLGEKRTQPLWLLPYLVFILFGTFILAYDMYEVCYGILKQ